MRDALSAAFVVCAILSRVELVAMIVYISQEHSQHVLERILGVLQSDGAVSADRSQTADSRRNDAGRGLS